MGAAWDDLRAAARDRTSGSAVVARSAAQALTALARELAQAPPDEQRRSLRDALRVLLAGQGFMAACLRLADACARAMSDDSPATAVARAAERFRHRLGDEAAALPSAVRVFLPDEGTIVTVSTSSAVVAALSRAPAGVRVLCALSEPGGEGRHAADELQAAGVDARVVPDSAVASAAAESQAVVFGADAIGPGGVLNKTGTLAAVLGARAAQRPRLAVAGTTKLLGRRTWQHVLRQASARTGRIDGTVEAPLFEVVPLRLLSRLVTEDGPLTASAALKLARASPLAPELLSLLEEGG